MTEPTDAEIVAVMRDGYNCRYNDEQDHIDFARAVLAKWGTPPAVAPWRSAVLDLIDDCPGLTLAQDRWLSRRVKELDFASTPQPTQAQAGAVPLTDEQIARIARSVLETPVTDGVAPAWTLAVGIARAIEAAHGIGIKGGQHGL